MLDNSREVERLQMLRDLAILDTLPEPEFDALAKVAKQLFGTKISLLTLIDQDRQWFKARCGLDLSETAREPSFCTLAVEADKPLVVSDALADPRFSNNPLVVGEPHIRFYAGVPVRARKTDGSGMVAIGALCVIDDHSREFSAEDLETLAGLACIAEALVESRAIALRSAELAESRREMVERLNREHRQLEQAERIADIGSWRLSLADNLVEWSDGVFAIHELPRGQMPPVETALDFYPDGDRQRVSQAIAKTIETGKPFKMECNFVTAKGNLRRIQSMGEIELSNGVPIAIIGVFQDITKRYHMEQALARIARTDELTRLPNRAAFNNVLGDRVMKAGITGEEFAVLLIDLDGFKQVNDTLGHAAGDKVLERVGERLRASWLSDCFSARLGGDEFAVIVPSPENRDAFRALVDRMLGDLRLTIEAGGVHASVSATIGIAWSQGELLPREELLRRADTALYSAKRSLKGTAQTFASAPL